MHKIDDVHKIDDIPNDFDCVKYLKYNPDLENLSDIMLKKHWINAGKFEGRLYKLSLPLNFIVEEYRFLNPDIEHMTDNELQIHYEKYGKKEQRKYYDKYFDFNFFVSKYENKNIKNINDAYLIYSKNITLEKNNFFGNYLNNLKFNPKNSIMLIDHKSDGTGACHYLYMLYENYKKQYKNVVLVLVKYSDFFLKKYNIKKSEVIEYFNDPTMLFMIYNKFTPIVMYMNSVNYAFYRIIDIVPREKLLFHSHEIKKHYFLSKKITPDYVVSYKIANEYMNRPGIQPPFLTNIDEILKLGNDYIDVIKNDFGILDNDKITLCMCGVLSERKNYKLFIEMAIIFPQYNFLWIGGDKCKKFIKYKNIYQITFTTNPYKYYNQIVDYFILFSLSDPCPFVVLENILFETPVIVFKENIYTDHCSSLLENIYYEYKTCISYENCIDAINKFVINKKNKNVHYKFGYQYIQMNYSKPHYILRELDCVKNIYHHTKKNKLFPFCITC